MTNVSRSLQKYVRYRVLSTLDSRLSRNHSHANMQMRQNSLTVASYFVNYSLIRRDKVLYRVIASEYQALNR